jgi:GT2 family glycosyltransferase
MAEVTVIILNYNGIQYLDACLSALRRQTFRDFRTVLVDNGSTDGSREFVRSRFPEAELIALPENIGFSGGVNAGIRAADTPFVILLNNDTEVFPDFVEAMVSGIRKRPKAFSCAAKMLQYHDPERLDGAGDFYSAMGWAYARGKDKAAEKYKKAARIFSSCAGAAIYRREYLNRTGLFDEEHFVYLEDLDLGYRARIAGYENWFLPDARVLHVGSASSGSRYNEFKIRYSARNNIYLIWKNMPLLQWLLNFPFLLAGFGIKALFFRRKGYGKIYRQGLKNGFALCRRPENRKKKVKFHWKNLGHYLRIQAELWANLVRRVL